MIDGQYSGVSMCQLSLPGFDGSADAFLTLIAQHKVTADEIPVADVTKQFLAHMTETEHVNLQLAGELMAASARLMVMKSAHLLSRPDDQEDEDTIDHRPFDPAQRQRYGEALGSLSLLEGRESFLPFAPPIEIERKSAPRSSDLLVRAWKELHTRTTTPERRLTVPGFVRLEAAVSGLIRALRNGSRVAFRQLVRGGSRNDTVMHFLAVLELVRQQRLHTEQDDLFADITLQWVSDSAESSSRLG